MSEKKERATRFHVATKDHLDPLVLLVKDSPAALAMWSKRTGRKEGEGVVTPIGTQATTITRLVSAEGSPAPPEAPKKK